MQDAFAQCVGCRATARAKVRRAVRHRRDFPLLTTRRRDADTGLLALVLNVQFDPRASRSKSQLRKKKPPKLLGGFSYLFRSESDDFPAPYGLFVERFDSPYWPEADDEAE